MFIEVFQIPVQNGLEDDQACQTTTNGCLKKSWLFRGLSQEWGKS